MIIPKYNCTKKLLVYNWLWVVSYGYQNETKNFPMSKTIIGAIEWIITYLLDNNLIWKYQTITK